VLDDTPPLAPIISSFSFSGSQVTVDVEDVHDPESGIAEIEYSVRFPSGRTMDWARLADIQNPLYQSSDYLDRTVPLLLALSLNGPTPNEVGIRVTNSNGLQTVVWSGQQFVAQNPRSEISEILMNGPLLFP